jgi:hypothetical protein
LIFFLQAHFSCILLTVTADPLKYLNTFTHTNHIKSDNATNIICTNHHHQQSNSAAVIFQYFKDWNHRHTKQNQTCQQVNRISPILKTKITDIQNKTKHASKSTELVQLQYNKQCWCAVPAKCVSRVLFPSWTYSADTWTFGSSMLASDGRWASVTCVHTTYWTF